MIKSKKLIVGCLAAMVLVASACGGGSAEEVDTSTGSASNGSANDEPDDSPQSETEESSAPQESPIADLLGVPITDDDEMAAYFGQLQRDAELKTSECMLAQGFEYTAVDYSNIDGFDVSVDFDSRSFAEEYGFGVATNPVGESFEAFEAFVDPNQEYTDSLSPGELEAYQSALTGELPDFDGSEDFENFQPGGCQGEAYNEAFAFGQVFDEFSDEFEEIEQAFEADPRIVAASSGWGTCMSEAGYSFSDQDDAESDFERRYRAIVNDPDAFAEDEDRDQAVVDDGDDQSFFFGPGTLKPEFQERVDALAEEERAVAIASWDCNGPLREIEGDIQVEYEQKFVDEHGAAISEALAS